MKSPQMPIASVETQEFLFSNTLVQNAARIAGDCKGEPDRVDWSKLRDNMRGAFRLQRFAMMNWLIMNGVSIPSELLSDQTHPAVGCQFPDSTQRADAYLTSAKSPIPEKTES